MKYDCKLIVKDNALLSEDNVFYNLDNSIFIKYKPQNKLFYDRFYILKELYNLKCGEIKAYPILYGIAEQLQDFNKMSMEEIEYMLIKYITINNKKQTKAKTEENEFKKQVSIAKGKQSKFTIEI